MDLRYEGHHPITDVTRIWKGSLWLRTMRGEYPTWLLASKAVLEEALSQFCRRAAWLWTNAFIQKGNSSALMNTSTVQEVILFVGNFKFLDATLDSWYHGLRHNTTHSCRGLAKAMKSHGRFKRLCVSGECSHHGVKDASAFAGTATFFAEFFRDVEIETLEFELNHREGPETRAVYRLASPGRLELVEVETFLWTYETGTSLL